MADDRPSVKQRLQARLNELREARAILAKRSATVNERKRQQRHARKNLETAQKRHPHNAALLDSLVHKLADAHELLDKAVLGQDEIEAREKRLEKKVKFLKDHLPDPAPTDQGVSIPDAPWNPSRRQISNSIVPWLYKTWAAGCHFSVTSGYRSPQYQCEICRSMCPGGCPGGCPGRCAPMGQSNHQHYGPHEGAVDVTNYYNFKATQYRIGSPLRNYLGGQDPVHFSFTGR
jgi:hypothetical protein